MKLFKIGDKVQLKKNFPFYKAKGIVTKVTDIKYNDRQIVYYTDEKGKHFKSLNVNLSKAR